MESEESNIIQKLYNSFATMNNECKSSYVFLDITRRKIASMGSPLKSILPNSTKCEKTDPCQGHGGATATFESGATLPLNISSSETGILQYYYFGETKETFHFTQNIPYCFRDTLDLLRRLDITKSTTDESFAQKKERLEREFREITDRLSKNDIESIVSIHEINCRVAGREIISIEINNSLIINLRDGTVIEDYDISFRTALAVVYFYMKHCPNLSQQLCKILDKDDNKKWISAQLRVSIDKRSEFAAHMATLKK